MTTPGSGRVSWGQIVKLKAYRELLGLTQADVAERLGTDQANVCRWEDGTIPRIEMVRKIREWSGGAVTAEDFYTEEVEQ